MLKFMLLPCLLLAFAISWQSCGTAQAGADGARTVDYSTLRSLADALRLHPGVRVEGGDNSAKVYIRGTSTIELETQPLYVIDGNPIGHNYSMANNAINMPSIKDIKVLRSRHETVIYGKEGVNGVILITTNNTAGN